MFTYTQPRQPWKNLLSLDEPLLLPAAHDALTARIIEQAGFKAYQVGGFALSGARHGFPDIDLTHYGEQSAGIRDIVTNCSLPVLVDADDCYGDVKNVTRVIQGYEFLGASAIFFEDQKSPKKCGHMSGKEVIPAKEMAQKVEAAVAARRDRNTFIIARTDAIAAHNMADALKRGEMYLKAGADGLFIEGPTNVAELELIAKTFKGVPKIANMFEGGGKTPLLKPSELREIGFEMIVYPTSILFRVAKTIQEAAKALMEGRQMTPAESIDMNEFERVVGIKDWEEIENRFQPDKTPISRLMQKVLG
jgi:2-methylisocitrate lyase-like PEP mutase family enzyme